jgi:hypothetical protein
MKYESLLKILRVLNRTKIQLSTKQIRARTKFGSDEGVRKILKWSFNMGYVLKLVIPPPKKVSPGRARYLWEISPSGREMVLRFTPQVECSSTRSGEEQ